MFCPECSAEYRAGYTRCSDCAVALVSALPPEEVDTDHGDEVVTVFVTRDIVEAETVKELLEANGIEVHVSGESSPLPGVPGEVRLFVNADDADNANRCIEEFSLLDEQEEDVEEDLNNVVPFPGPGYAHRE
jgi:hypothetical protein